MSDTPPVPAELTPPPTTDIPEVPQGGFNASQAATVLANRRGKEPAAEAPKNTEQKAVERPKEAAPAAQESGEEPGDAPPQEETSVDTQGEDDRAGEPPIDPPRSLSKEDKEFFRSLPRDRQERWASLERSRELEVRRIQNEAADSRKALEAKERAAEEARAKYEQRLPAVVQNLQTELAKKFPDIRNMDDVVRLAQTNPARHAEFQALWQRADFETREAQQVEARKRQEAEAWFEKFTADEDRKFLEAAPEFGDPKKADTLRREAAELLIDKGFTEQEINDLWSGRKPALVRDHRFQLIIRDAMRFRAAQKGIPNAKAAPTQPSVKPGIPPSKGERQASNIQTLQQKLARTGKVDAAVALLQAKRAS